MSIPRSLQRGLRVLELAAATSAPLSFATCRTALATSDSSTARLLTALGELGYLDKVGASGYQAGPALARLQSGGNPVDQLQRVAAPFVRSLARRCRNTVLLIGCTPSHMIVLDRAEHEESIALQQVGNVTDNWRDPPWGWLFRTIPEMPPRRPTSPPVSEIRNGLSCLRDHGYTIRYQPDRRRLAAPLHGRDGNIIAALAIGGTPNGLADDAIPRVGQLLVDHAASIQQLFTG